MYVCILAIEEMTGRKSPGYSPAASKLGGPIGTSAPSSAAPAA